MANRKVDETIMRVAAHRRKMTMRANNFATVSASSEIRARAQLQLDVCGDEIQGRNPLAVVCVVFHNAATVA